MKYLFFDCDDTLLDFHQAEAQALKRTLMQMDVVPTDEIVARYSAINQEMWELLEKKEITRGELLLRRFRILYGSLGLERSPEVTQEYYETFLAQGHAFVEGAPELLQWLRGKYRLYLVSNGTARVQAGRLRDSGIATYFEEIFISETMGVNKPERAFFDRCFEKIPGFQPEEAMIIGDSLTSDIWGGNNAGIKTCWFNPAGKPRKVGIHVDYELRSLGELPGLLREME